MVRKRMIEKAGPAACNAAFALCILRYENISLWEEGISLWKNINL